MKFNEISFFDYGFNKKYYAFMVNTYNKLKSKEKTFEDTWEELIHTDDFKMLEIDSEIVENVYNIFKDYYGKLDEVKSATEETPAEETKEIEVVDTIPDV